MPDLFYGHWAAILLDGSTVSGSLNDVFSVYAYDRKLTINVGREIREAIGRGELAPIDDASALHAESLVREPPVPTPNAWERVTPWAPYPGARTTGRRAAVVAEPELEG